MNGPFEKSPARQGVDWLLRMNPQLDLVEAEWQREGPWLLITLGQQSDTGDDVFARHPYAIWKRTGAVHGYDGSAVIDDPLHEPVES